MVWQDTERAAKRRTRYSGTSDLSGVWRCEAVVRSTYGVVRQEHRLSGHRSGCWVLIVRWTGSPHCHVEDFSAGPTSCVYGPGVTAMGCAGGIGDAFTHRSPGVESYYVFRHTFYFFTLGTSPASIETAHFRRAGTRFLVPGRRQILQRVLSKYQVPGTRYRLRIYTSVTVPVPSVMRPIA
jgi:hypothetical protein